jgi:hypothetical protein
MVFIAAQRIFLDSNSIIVLRCTSMYVNEIFSHFLLDFSVFISADGQRLMRAGSFGGPTKIVLSIETLICLDLERQPFMSTICVRSER